MTEFWQQAALVTLGAVLGAAVPSVSSLVWSWLFTPNLAIRVVRDAGSISPTTFYRKTDVRYGDGREPNFGTEIVADEGTYLRLQVTNDRRWLMLMPSPALECIGYLARIDLWDADRGLFVDVGYQDFVRLAWSYDGEAKGQSILPFSRHWLDVAFSHDGVNALLPAFSSMPNRYRQGFNRRGVYRFTIHLCCANAASITQEFFVRWDGQWQSMLIDAKFNSSWVPTIARPNANKIADNATPLEKRSSTEI